MKIIENIGKMLKQVLSVSDSDLSWNPNSAVNPQES